METLLIILKGTAILFLVVGLPDIIIHCYKLYLEYKELNKQIDEILRDNDVIDYE